MASANTLEAGIRNTVPDHGCPSFSIQCSLLGQVKNGTLYELTTNSTEKGQSLHDSLQSTQVPNLQEPKNPTVGLTTSAHGWRKEVLETQI